MGCFAMTETGHGSNVQALGTVATYDADDAGVRDHHARRPGSRKDYIGNAAAHAERGGGVRPARDRRRVRGRARVRRADPRRTARPLPGVRIEDDGRKIGLNGVDNGRLWFDGVRVPRDALLNRFADVTEDGAYASADREPEPALLHDARHPGPGPGLRRRRRHQRREGRARHRDRGTPSGAGSSRRRSDERGGAAPRLRHAPAPAVPAAGAHLRAALRPGGRRRPAARGVLRRRSTTTSEHAGASWSRGPPAPRRSAPGTPPAPSRSAARRAAAPATSPSTGSPRSRPTPTCSPRSRATTTCCCSWSPRGCSPTTPATSRTSTSSAWSGSSPGWPSRPWSSGPASHKLLERIKDVLPGGDDVGPGGRAARPELPARDAALPRGAHARRRRAPAQARHRRRA